MNNEFKQPGLRIINLIVKYIDQREIGYDRIGDLGIIDHDFRMMNSMEVSLTG